MGSVVVALLALRFVLANWTGRTQRVSRNVVLLALGGAARHPGLEESLYPPLLALGSTCSAALWLAAVGLAWLNWGWLGLLGVCAWTFVGALLSNAVNIPWPFHRSLEAAVLDDLLRRRVHSVAGHPEVYGRLLPTLLDVRKRLQAGEDFEAATFDRWAFHGGDHFRTPAESLSSTEDQVASEDGQSAVDSRNGEGLLGQDLSEEPDQAFADFRARAEAGDAGAQLNLGLMYDTGQGVPQDDVEAVRWYRLAADQGEATAQFFLGRMYAVGREVPQDDTEAVRWYRLAADQGEATAQFNLAVMYANGRGVPQDGVEAHMWVNLAASRSTGEDRETTVTARDTLAAQMTPEQLAEAQRRAREWDAAHPR